MLDLPSLYAECAPEVHQDTMSKIVSVESGGDPLVVNINGPGGGPRRFRDLATAVAFTERLDAMGRDYDAGLGQVNVRNRRRLGYTAAQLFDPCTNLRVSAAILVGCYQRAIQSGHQPGQPALIRALACYNSGRLEIEPRIGYLSKYGVVPALSATPHPPRLLPPRPVDPREVVVAAGPEWQAAVAMTLGELR